jgi:hypothetical protein|tara:strand:+ start:1387 stop:1620 length:234 start_codon:yes stop_codon:yes gene_type:complete
MSNQIKFTIDMSDELLDKLLTVMAMSQATTPLGGMPMQLMAMAQGAQGKAPQEEDKAPIGFGREGRGDEKVQQDPTD